MPDCPASSRSGTGMSKNADAGTIPVPEYGGSVRNAPVLDRDTGCRNADAVLGQPSSPLASLVTRIVTRTKFLTKEQSLYAIQYIDVVILGTAIGKGHDKEFPLYVGT
jgi:hypothetical protein